MTKTNVYKVIVIVLSGFFVGRPLWATDNHRQLSFYAIMDLFADRTHNAKGIKSSWRPGGMSPNFIGVKGKYQVTEEIELGIKGESYYDVVKHAWLDRAMGDKHATVAIKGLFGKVTTGRQFSTHAMMVGGEIDPFEVGFNGTAVLILDAGVDLLLRKEAVLYDSPSFGGFSFQLMKAQQKKVSDDGTNFRGDDSFVQGCYRGNGFLIGAVYVDQQKFKEGEWRRVLTVGGYFPVDKLTINLGFQKTLHKESDNDASEILFGLRSQLEDKQYLVGSYGLSLIDSKSNGADLFAIAYYYDISRTVTAYSSVAWLRNFGASKFSFTEGVDPGTDSSNLMLGGRIRL